MEKIKNNFYKEDYSAENSTIEEASEPKEVEEGSLIEECSDKQLVANTVRNIMAGLSDILKEYALGNSLTGFNNSSLAGIINEKIEAAIEIDNKLENLTDEIRLEIRSELAYIVHRDKFEKVKEFFLAENASRISPKWIKNKKYSLYSVIKRNIRKKILPLIGIL